MPEYPWVTKWIMLFHSAFLVNLEVHFFFLCLKNVLSYKLLSSFRTRCNDTYSESALCFFFEILFCYLFFIYCSSFCHTFTWISHGFTCVPPPNPPSRLTLWLLNMELNYFLVDCWGRKPLTRTRPLPHAQFQKMWLHRNLSGLKIKPLLSKSKDADFRRWTSWFSPHSQGFFVGVPETQVVVQPAFLPELCTYSLIFGHLSISGISESCISGSHVPWSRININFN